MTLNYDKINKLKDEQLFEFFETSIDNIISENESATESNLYQRFPQYTPKEIKEIQEDLQMTLNEVTLGVLSKEEFEDIISWVGRETKENICDLVFKMKPALKKQLILKEIKKVHHLTNFDYNVKYCVSSSKIMDLNEPMMSLFLHTKTAEGATKTLNIEMTNGELKAVLDLLKEARNKINKISS